MHSELRRVLFGILMLTMIMSLFGCAEKYTVDDITGVSLFESGMDRNSGYSYGLVREGGLWYLSAECGNVGRHEHFDCMYLQVEADELLDIINDGGYIKKIRSKKFSGVFAPDAPSRGVMLAFSDSTTQSAAISAPELRDEFARLVAALEAEIPIHSADETTGLYLSSNCTNADATCSFELFKDDGWRFSADCLLDGSRVTLENVSVDDNDADSLLEIAFDEGIDMKVFTYRALPDVVEVADGDSFSISMRFGKELRTADIISERLEEGFFDLTRKYADNEIPKEE